MNAQITAVKHKDIRDKEQLYLKIDNGKSVHVINIGVATYNKINEMEKELQAGVRTSTTETHSEENKVAEAPKKK